MDEERHGLGLRLGGDPRLNERSARWHQYIVEKQMCSKPQHETLIARYGKDHAVTHPEHWQKFVRDSKAEEKEINDRFLTENDEIQQKKGTSQCCYWACETPDGRQDKALLKCTGCGIVKYCCKDHQKLDWTWEHKGECTTNLPQFFKNDIEEDRQRNLSGDYSDYKL